MSDAPDAPAGSFRSTVLVFALLSILVIAVGWNHLPFDKGIFAFFKSDSSSDSQNDDDPDFFEASEFGDERLPLGIPQKTGTTSQNHNDISRPRSNPQNDSHPYRSTSYQRETQTEENSVPDSNALRFSQEFLQTPPAATSATTGMESSFPQETPSVSQEYLQYQTFLQENFGATETHLEYWGSDGKLVRFNCYVSSPKYNRGVKKHFHAIAATPAAAIEKIVKEVQLWHEKESQQEMKFPASLDQP